MFEWFLFSTRDLVREKTGLFFTLIFPILMVAILGTMLADTDVADSSIGTIRIVYSAEDEYFAGLLADGESIDGGIADQIRDDRPDTAHDDTDAMDAMAVNMFADGITESGGIEMTAAEDANAARLAVDAGEADAALLFESPMGIQVAEGEDLIKNRAVKLIAQSFAREYAAYAAMYTADNSGIADQDRNDSENAARVDSSVILSEANDLAGLESTGDSSAASQNDSERALIADKDLGVSRSMMDYYAVTMIVMIVFMGGGIGGASTMYQLRKDGLIRRMFCSPRGKTRLFIEAVAGVIPANILQALIVMILSTAFLGVHYAKTWQENLLLFAFFIVAGTAVTTLFMLVGLFVRVNPYMPLMAAIWTLLFLSGTFSKDLSIEGVSEYLPPNIMQRAAFDLTVFGRPEQALAVMGVCGLALALACVVGAVIFRKKETTF